MKKFLKNFILYYSIPLEVFVIVLQSIAFTGSFLNNADEIFTVIVVAPLVILEVLLYPFIFIGIPVVLIISRRKRAV